MNQYIGDVLGGSAQPKNSANTSGSSSDGLKIGDAGVERATQASTIENVVVGPQVHSKREAAASQRSRRVRNWFFVVAAILAIAVLIRAIYALNFAQPDTPAYTRTVVNAPLAQGLITAMEDKYLQSVDPRQFADTSAPIKAYRKAGYLKSKNVRVGATDYWLFKKSAPLFGLELAAIGEEYQKSPDGNSGGPGLVVILKGSANEELQAFSAMNHCSVLDVDQLGGNVAQQLSLSASNSYVAMSCRLADFTTQVQSN